MKAPRNKWVVPILVSVAIVVAAGGYWFARIHARADAATVQRHIAAANPGSTDVRCVSLQTDASTWVCGVVYHAESGCVGASVSVLGSVSVKSGRQRCDNITALKPMLPTVNAHGVATDVALQLHSPAEPFRCVELPSATPGHSGHWICGRKLGTTLDCRVVRVVPWALFNPQTSTRCTKPPFAPRPVHHPKKHKKH